MLGAGDDFSIATLTRHDHHRCTLLRWLMNIADASGRSAGCRYRIRWHWDCATPASAADVICLYVNIEHVALEGLYRIAEAKLLAAQKATDGRDHECK